VVRFVIVIRRRGRADRPPAGLTVRGWGGTIWGPGRGFRAWCGGIANQTQCRLAVHLWLLVNGGTRYGTAEAELVDSAADAALQADLEAVVVKELLLVDGVEVGAIKAIWRSPSRAAYFSPRLLFRYSSSFLKWAASAR